MALQNLILPIVSLFRSAGINQARNALGGLNKQYDSLGKTIGVAVGAMAGFNALQTAQRFVTDSVEATQKFERNLLALNQVFEEAAPQIKNFSKEVEDYGLSQQQAAQASVFLGSVLKQYGFSTSEAAGQTQRLVTLAQDLATTYGYDVQEALLAITALFRGEYDPIEKFGVAMKQNEINAERVARGMGDLTGAAQMQADAQIRLDLLFQRSTDSLGAFERAGNTLYGSQQKLNAQVENLQVAFGAPLQEPLAKVNDIFAELLKANGPEIVALAESLADTIDAATPIIALLGDTFLNITAALGPLIDALNVTIGLLGDIVQASNDAFAALADTTKETYSVDYDTAKANFQVKQLTEEQERLNRAIENGVDMYGTYAQRLEQIPREKVLAAMFVDVEMGARQAAAAMREAGYKARETQADLDTMAAANDAWTNSWTARALKYAEENGIAISELFKSTFVTGVGSSGTDYVGDFFDSIDEAVRKESARLKLQQMGASKGLVEKILGANGWEEVFKRIVRGGVDGLKELQQQYNLTADGIEEITKALEDAKKAQQEFTDQAQAMIDKNIADAEREYEEKKRLWEAARDRADEFRKWTLDNITNLEILPDVEAQLGRFESSIVSAVASMQAELVSAARSDLIFEEDFANLRSWVDAESQALLEIAQRRDELADRYSLGESLISEYQKALTGALSLTSLFGKLESETQKKTVTEVTEGVVQMGAAMREFGITVTRSYEETIEGVTDKTEGLLQGFRDIAQRARDFAANLQKLRDMGLDPMLFNQLVQAGAEAGGDTAQAIIDGGQDSVDELNSIFQELNELGAELGMDVGQTMYEAGQDMTYGLLDGLKSEQEALLELARSMAEAFSSEFKSKLDIAIEAPVAAAEQAMNDAGAALEQAKSANADLLGQVLQLAEGARTALGGPLPSSYVAGVTEKLGIFESLIPDIVSGKVTELPGLTAGLSTADVKDIVSASGATVSNTFNVNVSADTRTGGTKAGEATVEVLKAYTDNNGSLSTWVTV